MSSTPSTGLDCSLVTGVSLSLPETALSLISLGSVTHLALGQGASKVHLSLVTSVIYCVTPQLQSSKTLRPQAEA